jgi:hypothetical protein
MAPIPGSLAATPWNNQDIFLYHGTIDIHVQSIRKGVNVMLGNPRTDFGRGFYTTTIRRQARSWAWQLAVDYNAKKAPQLPRAYARVIRFRVRRDRLAQLETLVFVRGDFHATDYWSLVRHCRSGEPGTCDRCRRT